MTERPSRVARLVAPPRTGWGSVVVLGLMLLVAGLAVDLPRIAGQVPGGSASQTAFLPATLVLAGLVGVLLARLPLPVTLAHLVGCIIGVAVLLVGWAGAASVDPSLWVRLRALDAAATDLFQDLVVDRLRSTDQTVGFLVVVGAVAWTTGQFAAYNLVRRGLVAPAVVAIGTLMLIIALAPQVDAAEIYPHLVVLTGMGLVLVLRANLAHQQAGWRRRRIAGGPGVSRPFLRGGLAVCLAAMVGAAGLAGSLAGAPLQDAATSVDQRVLQLADLLRALFGGIDPPSDASSGSYGERAPMTDTWSTSNEIVFTVTGERDQQHYWQGATHQRYTEADGWTQDSLDLRTRSIAAGMELLEGTGDLEGVRPGHTRRLVLEVTNVAMAGDTVLAPALASTLDRDSTVILDGDAGPLAEIEFRAPLERGSTYRVEVEVPARGDRAVTQSMLAAAGMGYPTWIEPYMEVVDGTLSDAARALAENLATRSGGPSDPFHVAARFEAYFAGIGQYADRDDPFLYDTDLRGDCAEGATTTECLLASKRGFCIQYATTMALMLRSRNIPARYVLGFLPGERAEDGSSTVRKSGAHAWVQVFFPGYGWIQFDPTPGSRNRNGRNADSIDVGVPVPAPTPLPSVAPTPTPLPTPDPTPEPSPSSPPMPEESKTLLGLEMPWLAAIVAAAVVLGLTVAWAVRRARRVPGRSPEVLYRALAALAARSGHGPRPEQTPYEFTDALSATIPGAAADLHAVARARVEAVYGGRQMDGGAVDGLIASFRRARRALRGLFFRRPAGRG